jgi:secondary thiamine-phosphate synthase enzyme
VLIENRERCVCEYILGCARGKLEGGGDGFVVLACILQGANEPVSRVEEVWIGCNGGAEAERGGVRIAFREVVESLVVLAFRIGIRVRHADSMIVDVSMIDCMKAHTDYLWFNTAREREMVHITPQVEAIVRASGVQDGLCFVSPMHITAAIYVNDHESGLIEDISQWLEKLAPARPEYKHHQTGEDNADAHLKALLLHHETTLPITDGRLDLGTWQRIFYAEFDGQRRKRVIVKILGI